MGKYRNIFFSETIALIEPKLGINHWKVSAKSPLTTCVTCEFGARSLRGVLDTTMRYKFCQLHCSRLVGLFRNWRNPFTEIFSSLKLLH
jgi:hypothetical protein